MKENTLLALQNINCSDHLCHVLFYCQHHILSIVSLSLLEIISVGWLMQDSPAFSMNFVSANSLPNLSLCLNRISPVSRRGLQSLHIFKWSVSPELWISVIQFLACCSSHVFMHFPVCPMYIFPWANQREKGCVRGLCMLSLTGPRRRYRGTIYGQLSHAKENSQVFRAESGRLINSGSTQNAN